MLAAESGAVCVCFYVCVFMFVSDANADVAGCLDMGLEVCLDFPLLLLVVLVVLLTRPQAAAYNLHIICVHFILFHPPSIACGIYAGRGSAYPPFSAQLY